MPGDIATHILSRVAEFVGASKDMVPTQLYDLLYGYRFTVHPDKYREDNDKKEAEERFKTASALLEELSSYIQQQTLAASPKDLIPLQREYDLVRVRDQVILKDNELAEAKQELESVRWELRKAKEKIKSLGATKITDTRKAVAREHGFRSGPTVSAAAGIAIGVSWAALSQLIDSIGKLKGSLPLKGIWTDWASVGVVVVCAVWFLLRLYGKFRIRRWMTTISLASFAASFDDYLVRLKKQREFTDHDVFDFLKEVFFSRNLILRALGIKTHSYFVLEELKNAFVIGLLAKDLIERSGSTGLIAKYQPTDWYSRVVKEAEANGESESSGQENE